MLKPQQVFTLVNTTVYEVKSIAQAVEICFKCFFVFNVEYPPTAILPWYFLQKHIFKIDSAHDRAIKKSKVNELIGRIIHCK